jgi:hypothetical protein
MTKGLISIFVLPHEIDNLHLTLYNLRRNAELVMKDVEYKFDITLCLSDEMVDWSQSKLPREYFEDKFDDIVSTLWKWADPKSIARVEYGNKILGCVSQRRHTLQYVDESDFTLWLDNDLFFGDRFLGYLGNAVKAIKNSGVDYYIVTPQITRQWDTTWDVLVHDDLLSRELNDNLTANVFDLGLRDTGVAVRPINTFKAAGGWGTVISNKLLKVTGIPESFGHYGLEDTYVLTCAQMLRESKKLPVQQYVLDGILVCENHQQNNKYLNDLVSSIDRKDEFRQIATQHFPKELERFYNENILQNK